MVNFFQNVFDNKLNVLKNNIELNQKNKNVDFSDNICEMKDESVLEKTEQLAALTSLNFC